MNSIICESVLESIKDEVFTEQTIYMSRVDQSFRKLLTNIFESDSSIEKIQVNILYNSNDAQPYSAALYAIYNQRRKVAIEDKGLNETFLDCFLDYVFYLYEGTTVVFDRDLDYDVY